MAVDNATLKKTLLSVKTVRVLMAGQPVGTAAMTEDGLLAFEYESDWIESGFSISPLSLPLEQRVFVADYYPNNGVFGVFEDSIPDGWGRLVTDRALKARGIDPDSLNACARLAIVGAHGMGALEYEPEYDVVGDAHSEDLDALAADCMRIWANGTAQNLDELFALGGSSGGARPKALWEEDGEQWVVKFPYSKEAAETGVMEYAYSLAAKACGIHMPETRLFPSSRTPGYFGTRRFDRLGSAGHTKKVHMVSAAALLETTHRIPNLDYAQLMKLSMLVTEDISSCEELFRIMCFNVLAGNCDDHSRNFSFLHDADNRGGWRLSPAYDLTRSEGVNGERQMTVNGKGKDIQREDLFAVGGRFGLSDRFMHAAYSDVCSTVKSLERWLS